MRFDVPPLDKELGIEAYLTDTDGIGGRLRTVMEDFAVEEIPQGGSSVQEFVSGSLARSPSRYENYAICLLEKRGIDTLTAASLLADRLHLKEEEIGYSGLKDAKALTRQLVSLPWRRPLQREYEFPEGLRLELLGFRYRPLSIGELSGNQFSITARKIDLEQEELLHRLKQVEKELRQRGGFPAYFGYQRFGSRRPISHLVGKMLHQGNWQGALDTLLAKSSVGEFSQSETTQDKLAYDLDYSKASEYFPPYLGVERRLLDHLRKHPRDSEGTLKKLPRRLAKLFYDAYQSYIFNRALSIRLRKRKSPTEILAGDLLASFDERGYVRRLTKASAKTLAMTQNAVEEGRVVPVIAVPAILSGKSAHPISQEVVSILEGEELASTGNRLSSGKGATGIVRPILTEAENLGWIAGEDDLNIASRKATFYFRLRRGFYASILLREFLKPRDPSNAGF